MGKSTEQIDPSKPLKSAAQEQFCLNISKGMEQGPAYRAVPAYKSKDPDQAASSLIRIPKVAERIRYLRDQVCKIAVLDRSYVVRGLMNVADTCGQHIPLRGYRGKKCLIDANGANGALDKLAKIEGSYERDNDQKNKGWDDYLAWLNSK